jgi:hypothetical protein
MPNNIDRLKEEIAHCERMARAVFDELTSRYLLAFAAECRRDLDRLTGQVA